MNKIALSIRLLRRDEDRLASEMLAVGERHRTDQEVYHLTRTLAALSQDHVRALAEFAGGTPDDEEDDGGWRSELREKAAELVGRRPEPGLLLLRDVRKLHLMAAQTSIDWVILGQAAQAARDLDLLAVVTRCHPETLRQLRWTVTKLKEAAPQVLTS